MSDPEAVIKSGGLRTADSYIRSGPYDASDATGLDAATNLIIIDELSAERSGFFSPDFDPFTFMSVTGDDPIERVRFYYENRKEEGLSNVRVTTSASLVTIVNSSKDGNLQWEYVFDLAQGGLPVRVQGSSKSPESLDSRESTYQQIDGVWLPSTTEIKSSVGGKTRKHRTLTWTDHELNREIDPAEFTLASFDMVAGNTVVDKRSKSQVMFEPEEFHQKFKDQIRTKSKSTAATPTTAPKSSSTTFLVITSLNVIVVASLLFSWLYFARAKGATE